MTVCQGGGTDMSEYSEAAQKDGWCMTCAPECYDWRGVFIG